MSIFVTEFGQLGEMINGQLVQAVDFRKVINYQEDTSTSTANETMTLAAGTRYIRVTVTEATYIAFGSSADATSAGDRFLLPANTVEYYVVNASETLAHADVA